MEIISNGGGGMRQRLSKLGIKNGFYIILLLGISLIATTVLVASKRNTGDLNKVKLDEAEDFIILDEETEPSLEITRMDEGPIIDDYIRNRGIRETFEEDYEADGEMEEEFEEELDEDLDYTLVDSEASTDLETMIKPVEGNLGAGFTNGNLIYSKTLEEWTSHRGIDILAVEGTEVKAVSSGIVTEVYNDKMWGIVIIIDHGNGLLTKYANLSTSDMVVEGTRVNKGDVISTVGQTASIEMMEESHLHFEVIRDGINEDPLNYLPVFSSGK